MRIVGVARCRSCGYSTTAVRDTSEPWPKHDGRCIECDRKELHVAQWWPMALDAGLVQTIAQDDANRALAKVILQNRKRAN